MTPLALLCEIIASGGKSNAASFRDRSAFEALLCHGFLREAGVVASVVCDDCEDAHAAPLVFEDGYYGYHCPELGFVQLDRTEVQAVLPVVNRLIDGLVEAVDCKRRKQTPVRGQTWRIGALGTDAGEIMLYFHPRLQSEEDARELVDALNREVRSRWRLVITAIGQLPVAGTQTILLDDFAALDADTGALRILRYPAELAGVPYKNKGGRPSEHGALLLGLISERSKNGAALPGLNAESRAILVEFNQRHPDRQAPSFETIRRHLRRARSGS